MPLPATGSQPKPPSPSASDKPAALPAVAQAPAATAPTGLPTPTGGVPAIIAPAGSLLAPTISGSGDSAATTPAGSAPPCGLQAEQSIACVLQYATQHHPLLRVHQFEIEAARAKIVTARLLPNPELTVDTLDSSGVPAAPELSTRLMFTLPIGPKRELRTAAAETGVSEAQLAMSRATKAILAEAADAAVEVLYIQERYALYGHLSKLAKEVVDIQQERFNIAAVPYRNVVLTQLAASRLELMRQNTATELDQAKVRLARAVGATDAMPPPVEGRLAVQPVAFAPVAAMQARIRQVAPELAESSAVIEKSKEELSLEQWKALPDLKIGPRYRADLSGETDDRWGARVQCDVPVFDRNQGHIAEGAAMLRTNCAKRDLVEVTTVSDATALYMELQDVQARADYYSAQIRPLSERTEKTLREAFQDREVTAYEITDLLESLAHMELSDLEVRHEHQRLRMRLELLLECRLPPAPVRGAGVVQHGAENEEQGLASTGQGTPVTPLGGQKAGEQRAASNELAARGTERRAESKGQSADKMSAKVSASEAAPILTASLPAPPASSSLGLPGAALPIQPPRSPAATPPSTASMPIPPLAPIRCRKAACQPFPGRASCCPTARQYPCFVSLKPVLKVTSKSSPGWP